MTKITLKPPSVGEKDTVAEPAVTTALKEVEKFLNEKNIETTDNIKAEGIAEASLSKALQEKLTSRVGLKLEVKNESLTAVSENFYEMQKEGSTLTLPAPTLNRITGAFCTGGIKEIKVTASSGKIYGDYIKGETTVTVLEYQHVLVQADGSNWLILAGEPKREQKYEVQVARTSGVEYEPSATRPVEVIVQYKGKISETLSAETEVGGILIGNQSVGGVVGVVPLLCLSFKCNPGEKWKPVSGSSEAIKSTYRTL